MVASDDVTAHAAQRAGQRGVSLEAMKAAQEYGDEIKQYNGRRAFFIGKRAVKRARRKGQDIACYENTAVVIGIDGSVVTVIRVDSPRKISR